MSPGTRVDAVSQVHFEARDGVAVLRLDNPPVNSLGLELRTGIVAAVARAEDEPAIRAVIIVGSGKGFSGALISVNSARPSPSRRRTC